MSTQIDALIYALAGTIRGWSGALVKDRRARQPEKTLKLYDIEASPFCRLVREVLTEMDLDVMILPCPSGGMRFRPEAARVLGRKPQFPLLVDDNTGTTMVESADIIAYLSKIYGSTPRSSRGIGRIFALTGSVIATLMMLRRRGITGMKAVPSKGAEKPLELYSFEASPYSKPVRARLCELELPYLLHNTGKGALKDIGPPSVRDKLFKAPQGTSRNRKWLSENTGRVQVPYLIDRNTGIAMYESQAILGYLDHTYALSKAS
jgi:glutathione S-transferase